MSRKPWTPIEIETLAQLYPDTRTADLAALLGRPVLTVYAKAKNLGLRKSETFLESPAAGRLRRGDQIGRKTQFGAGHVPANKGLRRPGYAPGRMAETQFKEGEKPHTWRPIGTERLADGYLQRKMTDTGYPPRDWQPVHRLLWEDAHGPIPPDHVVIFLDGDRSNVALSNLSLASRSELGRLNSMWNRYPRELAETIQLAGALKRKINRRNAREKQD